MGKWGSQKRHTQLWKRPLFLTLDWERDLFWPWKQKERSKSLLYWEKMILVWLDHVWWKMGHVLLPFHFIYLFLFNMILSSFCFYLFGSQSSSSCFGYIYKCKLFASLQLFSRFFIELISNSGCIYQIITEFKSWELYWGRISY